MRRRNLLIAALALLAVVVAVWFLVRPRASEPPPVTETKPAAPAPTKPQVEATRPHPRPRRAEESRPAPFREPQAQTTPAPEPSLVEPPSDTAPSAGIVPAPTLPSAGGDASRVRPPSPAPPPAAPPQYTPDPAAMALRDLRQRLQSIENRSQSLHARAGMYRSQHSRLGTEPAFDITSTQQELDHHLNETEEAITLRDVRAARRHLDAAERELERIERVLGR